MRDEVYKFLDRLDVEYRVEEHEAVFTVAESAKVLTEKVPVKTLLLREEKGERRLMVAMRGDKRLDLKGLAAALDSRRLVFVKADELEYLIGVKPGSVSIFGLLHPNAKNIEALIDNTIMNEEEISFHPNDNTATVFFKASDLPNLIKAMGHKPRQVTI